jgi:hypothetical protein
LTESSTTSCSGQHLVPAGVDDRRLARPAVELVVVLLPEVGVAAAGAGPPEVMRQQLALLA